MKRITKFVCVILGGLLYGSAASAALVGYWQFEEGSGLTTADSSGYGATGTLQNGATVPTWQPGKVGNYSLEFNTSNAANDANISRVNVGNPVQLQFSNAMTIAAWVYLDSATVSSGSIASKMGASGLRGWRLGNDNTTQAWELGIAVTGSSTITYRATAGSATSAVGTWTHVAGVYNGTNQTMALYVNGLPIAGALVSGSIPSVMNSPAVNVALGGRANDFSQKWDGKLDEVRIYDEALSDAEILSLAQGGVTPLAFTLEPTDLAVIENQAASFTTEFTGSPAAIQWYSNNVAIDGANSSTYTIPSTSLTMSGDQYKVVITNAGPYSITSSNATLIVNADTTKPTIVSVSALGYSNQVIVTFSEPITLASAENPSNYAITNTLGSPVNVNVATLGADALTVTLTTDPLTEMTNYVLVVNGIQDLAATPNTILPDSLAPFTHSTLVGYWKLDEGTGTTTADSGIGGFTGTLAGDPLPTWVPGYVGPAALEFSGGGSSRVAIGNPAPLQLTGALTLSVWAYADTWTGGRLVTKGGGSGSRGWELNTETAGYWSLLIPYSSTSLVSVQTDPGTVPLGAWTHVAGVYDPNDPGGASMKIYTNGVLAAMRNDFLVPIQMYNPPNISVAIGARADASTRWDGKIDDVRIYARALSEAEIYSLVYGNGSPLAFTLEPTNQTVLENQPASFTTAFTVSPAVIQWYSNNVPIDGANNLTYTIPAAAVSMSGDQYKVVITNASYSITSSNATLTVTADTTKPTIASVSALGYSNQVVVTFSEPITLASAENPSNYAITNTLGSPINVSLATLAADAMTVTLTTDPLTEMSNYVLVVNGIQDLAATPNTILPDSLAPFTHSTLVGYWKLDEGTGTDAFDSGIGGLTGTLAGDPLPTWVPGYLSPAALEFPGNADSRVAIGNPAPLQLTGALTLTAMAFPDAWGQGRIVTKGGGNGARGWEFCTENTGYWSFKVAYDPNTLVTIDTDPGSVATNVWTHVAGVYDPDDPGGPSMKFYTNGVLAAMRNDFLVPIVMYNPPTTGVAIGARSDGSTRWDGKIDDVRIYARALSEAEIQALIPSPPLEFLQPVVSGDQLTLSWTGEGQLQAAPEVTGTYTNYTPTPTSPYVETIVPGEKKFFRLIAP